MFIKEQGDPESLVWWDSSCQRRPPDVSWCVEQSRTCWRIVSRTRCTCTAFPPCEFSSAPQGCTERQTPFHSLGTCMDGHLYVSAGGWPGCPACGKSGHTPRSCRVSPLYGSSGGLPEYPECKKFYNLQLLEKIQWINILQLKNFYVDAWKFQKLLFGLKPFCCSRF